MSETNPPHAQLYDAMVHRIRTGVWKPGERVPSEKSLIAEFGSSRGPVRQALAALRSEGLISGGRGAPPRVQHTAPSQSFDTFMSFTEWARGLGFTPGQRIIEASRRAAPEDIARELRIAPDAPIVEVIRLRLLDGRPTMLERSTFPYEIGKHLLAADLGEGIYQQLGWRGIAPARARHIIDAIAAHPLEAEQLHVAAGSPILRARRIAYDELGNVLEIADDRYLPSMANFVVENSAASSSRFARQLLAASR